MERGERNSHARHPIDSMTRSACGGVSGIGQEWLSRISKRPSELRRPPLPVAGLTMEMHDREDLDVIGILGVQDPVGKPVGLQPTDLAIQNRPCQGISDDPFDGGVDLDGERMTQTGPAFLVVVDGFEEFRLGLGMERPIHGVKRSQIRANTSVPGTACTSPV